jgi:hypothetical protein
MKLRTILLAGMLLATPILVMADEVTDVSILIEEAKNATPDKRFSIINEIKTQIATMNEDDRAVALAEVQAARDGVRQERQGQFGAEMTEDKIAEIKANMTPEQVEAFDARMESRQNGEGRRQGPPSEEQIAVIKANMTPEQEVAFDARMAERQANGFTGRPDGVRPDNIPEGATRPDGLGRPEGVGRPDGVGRDAGATNRPDGVGRPANIPEGATRPDGVGRPSGVGRP